MIFILEYEYINLILNRKCLCEIMTIEKKYFNTLGESSIWQVIIIVDKIYVQI